MYILTVYGHAKVQKKKIPTKKKYNFFLLKVKIIEICRRPTDQRGSNYRIYIYILVVFKGQEFENQRSLFA